MKFPYLVISSIFLVLTSSASAATITYSDRVSFEAALGSQVVDDYSAPAYAAGDIIDIPGVGFDIHTDANISSILGETDYVSTGFINNNIITNQFSNAAYCAGCNGSFELGFTTTSVGNSSGVYGVGFDTTPNSNSNSFIAFVTFADNSTANYATPGSNSFWGITSDLLITMIHFGLADGGTTTNGSFAIDNLTIGSNGSEVPEPGSLVLLGLGSIGVAMIRRKKALTS